jgi:hypothetical protein
MAQQWISPYSTRFRRGQWKGGGDYGFGKDHPCNSTTLHGSVKMYQQSHSWVDLTTSFLSKGPKYMDAAVSPCFTGYVLTHQK